MHDMSKSCDGSMQEPLGAAAIGRWREELESGQLALVRSVGGDLLTEFGNLGCEG